MTSSHRKAPAHFQRTIWMRRRHAQSWGSFHHPLQLLFARSVPLVHRWRVPIRGSRAGQGRPVLWIDRGTESYAVRRQLRNNLQLRSWFGPTAQLWACGKENHDRGLESVRRNQRPIPWINHPIHACLINQNHSHRSGRRNNGRGQSDHAGRGAHKQHALHGDGRALGV